MNGSEDGHIYCFKASQSRENAADNLLSQREMFIEPAFNPFFANNDDCNDNGDEWKFALNLTEHNNHLLINFENYFCIN